MLICTRRLVIRDFVLGDADDLHEILGDGEVMRCLEPPYSAEKTENFLRSFCIERRGAFAAAERETGKVVGYLLFNESDTPGIYEMGWIFNKSYWRRGYAYEACRALIDYGFDVLGLHKICAETIDAEKSVGLMRKLGMRPEGVFRGHARDLGGEWVDVHWYGILAGDK
ncbi:putative N-acetyltransferase YnaD [Clostridia bacterium]|nr:putative N-acetyltransferase YnaD [Clostridia bacterium]